jgi:hypothetical protein
MTRENEFKEIYANGMYAFVNENYADSIDLFTQTFVAIINWADTNPESRCRPMRYMIIPACVKNNLDASHLSQLYAENC